MPHLLETIILEKQEKKKYDKKVYLFIYVILLEMRENMSERTNHSDAEKLSYSNKIKEAFNHWLGLFLVILAAFIIILAILNLEQLLDIVFGLVRMVKPVVYGCVIAYILNPLVNQCNLIARKCYQKLRWTWTAKTEKTMNGISICLSLIIAIIIIAILMWLIIPQLVITVAGLINTLPDEIALYYQKITEYIKDNDFLKGQMEKAILNATDSAEKILTDQVLPWLQSSLLPSVNNMAMMLANGVMNLFSVIYNLFIGLIVAIYLLGSKKTFLAQAKKIIYAVFSKDSADMVLHYTLISHKMFSGFIVGKIVDSTIVGIIVFVLMQIFGLPYAMLISVIVGVTNIIPVFGPYIGLIPSALLILLVDPMQAVTFIIIIAILQQVDGNIIGPAILGESTGLSAFWVLFSILFFGGLWGLAGMIVGVPLFAVLYQIIRDCINWRLQKKNFSTDTEIYRDLKEVKIGPGQEVVYIKYTENDFDKPKQEKNKLKEENQTLFMRFIKFINEKSDKSEGKIRKNTKGKHSEKK